MSEYETDSEYTCDHCRGVSRPVEDANGQTRWLCAAHEDEFRDQCPDCGAKECDGRRCWACAMLYRHEMAAEVEAAE